MPTRSSSSAPPYLSELCIPVSTSTGRHFLRSATYGDLLVPILLRTSTSTYAPRSFDVSGPSVWNKLPATLRVSPTLGLFQSKLKQYFFARPTRHDSARSWLLRLLELRLTNVPTYLLSRRNWNAGRERSYVILVVGVRFFWDTPHIQPFWHRLRLWRTNRRTGRQNCRGLCVLRLRVLWLHAVRRGTSLCCLVATLQHLVNEWLLLCPACRAVSEVSSFFNIPLISWVATDPDFDDKIAYSTLSRTLGPFSKLADFLLEVFLQYNWRRVIVISSNYLLYLEPTCCTWNLPALLRTYLLYLEFTCCTWNLPALLRRWKSHSQGVQWKQHHSRLHVQLQP